MKKGLYSVFLPLLIILSFLVFQDNITLAANRRKDLFSIQNKEANYYYYSSPDGSAYINTLPHNYAHVNTQLVNTIDSLNITTGQVVQFKTVEPIVLSDFLTLPQNSIIYGKVIRNELPKKLIRSSNLIINFDKVLCPNNYELQLSKDTFEVQPLVVKNGSRYQFSKEIGYGLVAGGLKYPISRFLNIGISYGILSGAGLIGGIVYGALVDDIPKNMGLGLLRGSSGKLVYNVVFLTGKSFTINPDTPFLLTVNKNFIDKMQYNPKYLNIQQLMMASSMNDDRKLNDKLIAKSADNNIGSSQVIDFYKESIKNNSENIELKIDLGRSYMASGRYQDAIKNFNDILASGISDPRVYYYLAQALENSGNLADAQKNYYLALNNNFSDKEIYLKLGNLLNKMGKPSEAAEYFNKYNSMVLVNK